MSPMPENPQQGKVEDTSAEDAADGREPVRGDSGRRARTSAEGTAAAETGIDKRRQAESRRRRAEAEAVAPAETEDQQERADAEAARAAAAEEAAEAADEAGTRPRGRCRGGRGGRREGRGGRRRPPRRSPRREKSRKAREAEQAADQAEEAADEAKKSARRVRSRRGDKKAKEEPKRKGRKEVPVGLKVSAQAKYVRTSARKARLVCDHIRDKDVVEARAILAFTTRDAAKAWSKLLESAVANAEHNHELVGEELRIFNVHADEGPTLKRYRPRAMGRATRIRKRTSHLSITLTPKES